MDMACKISKEVSVIEILVSLVSSTLYCRTCRFRCKLQKFPIALLPFFGLCLTPLSFWFPFCRRGRGGEFANYSTWRFNICDCGNGV